jgi:hypothetical protein
MDEFKNDLQNLNIDPYKSSGMIPTKHGFVSVSASGFVSAFVPAAVVAAVPDAAAA